MKGHDPHEMPDDPELADLLRVMAQSIRIGLRTHVPASIVAYNPATQTARVQVELRTVVRVPSIDTLPPGATLVSPPPNGRAVLPPTQMNDIPVIFPGTETAYLTVPVLPGATGSLHVHDRCLDAWLKPGPFVGVPADPVAAWTHALESSEFHLGLRPATKPIVPPTDLTATVVEGPLVKMGRLAASAAIKGTEFVTAMDVAIAAAILAGTGAPGGTGAAAFTAFQTSWNLAKVGFQSIKVQVE